MYLLLHRSVIAAFHCGVPVLCETLGFLRFTALALPLAAASRWVSLPVDPRALDAEQHPQVDGGPAGSRLAAVAAKLIAGEALHPLQEALATSSCAPVSPVAALPGLAGRVDAAGGGRCRPV